MKRLFIIILIVIIALLASYYSYQVYLKPLPNSNMAIPPVAVEAVKVIASDVPDHIQATGTLQANQSVEISPEFAGQVASIMFTNGQKVDAGEPLVQLDDTDAQAQLKSAKADLHLSKVKYDRIVELVKQAALSQQSLDEAKATLLQQQALLSEKQNVVNKMLLRAPFAGTVTSRKVDDGQYIDVGQDLVQLVDSSQLKVSYQVPEQQMPLLQMGQEATVNTSAYPGQTFDGKVSYISPVLNTDTRTVEVHAIIPNEKSLLKPGMFVDINQLLAVRPNMPIVPIQALVPSLGGTFVYVIDKGVAIQTKVAIGERWRANAEILSGLKPGQVIVAAGQQRLRDGSKVKVTKNDKVNLPADLQ
tara:strand:- start:3583 stop:4662 length:1080 start_codon:yes stop_codon:yes gene_type:complete